MMAAKRRMRRLRRSHRKREAASPFPLYAKSTIMMARSSADDTDRSMMDDDGKRSRDRPEGMSAETRRLGRMER